MKTKDLINKIEVETMNNSESTCFVKDIMYLFIKKLFSNLVILLIILMLSILLIDKVSILSFVDPTFYVGIVLTFTVLETLLYIIMFSLYIYKERKNCFKENFKLQKLLKAYKHYDLISYILNVVAVVYFLVMFVATPAQVVGSSMEDTYHDSDRVLVWHLFYEPKRDDVVIIEMNDNLMTDSTYINAEMIIKRVIALPGDKVTYKLNPRLKDCELYVNDKFITNYVSLDEYHNMLTYLKDDKKYYTNFESTVPEGYYICLGDNRRNSSDSRYFGLIPVANILGKSILRIYPLKDFGIPDKVVKN